jgi:hypothetical protein
MVRSQLNMTPKRTVQVFAEEKIKCIVIMRVTSPFNISAAEKQMIEELNLGVDVANIFLKVCHPDGTVNKIQPIEVKNSSIERTEESQYA